MTVVPWPSVEIRTIASIGTGAKDTQNRDPNGKYPFFVRSQKVERIDSWSFEGEAVLTAGDGVGTGKVFHYIDGKFDYHQRVYRISDFRRDVSGRYFFHQFSRNFLARIESLTAKSSVDSVRMDTIAGMRIPLPSRIEQGRIAEAIDDADDLIATLERLITKKQAIKQGMMQQLLTGKTRLPGFAEPWVETQLGSLGKCIRGVGYDPGEDLSSGDRPHTVRLLRSNNVQDGRIDRYGLQFVHERRVSTEQLLGPGDIVICMANGSRALVGKAALFETKHSEPRYTFGAFMGAFRTDSSLANPRFVAETMRTHAFRSWLDVILSGSSINNLRPADVEGFRTHVPDLTEQAAIAGVLGDADRELAVLRERLVKARATKQGMMQELLTGRTRLPVEEVAA